MKNTIKVMVVDDTITYRQILSKVTEAFDNVELVGTASGGQTCLMKLPALKPDLVFLDVMMPDMDGIETLREIKKVAPKTQVVMVSAFDLENAKATIESLELGALDFVGKPVAENMQDGISKLQEALGPLISLVHEQVFGKAEPKPAAAKATGAKTQKSTPAIKDSIGEVDFLVLGISTGGPNALHEFFHALKEPLPCPVLIVQHMPPMFTQSLADRLDSTSVMTVTEGKDGETPQPGHAYVAPGGLHMVLRKVPTGSYQLGIVDSPAINHCKPAVDVLFRSVAGISGLNALPVIMTGMGRDGTEGVKALKRRGAYCLIQDEATSVVWGMPGSVYDADCADEVLSLKALPARIAQLTRKP